MGWYGEQMGAWGWPVMALAMIVVWGLLITGLVLLVRFRGQRGPTPPDAPSRESADVLLAERFARSDIDETEYRSRLAALHDAAPS